MSKPKLLGAYTKDTHTITAKGADYAEVGEWADLNTSNEDRIGYFVSVDTSTPGMTMVKATSTSDVRGATMSNPGFSANADPSKYDSNGNLLAKYDYVGFAGFVPVIDNGRCTVNGRCVSDDNGTAIPSTNSYGYQVISRIDANHILVLIEPHGDTLNKIAASFQAGCDTLVQTATALGSTPASNSPTDIATAMNSLNKVGTAVTEDVLSGKTFTNASSVGLTGSMVDNKTSRLYVSSLGTNTVSKDFDNYTPIAITSTLGIDDNTHAITKDTAITFDEPLNTFGYATASSVLSGSTFSSGYGIKQTGSIPNRGAQSTESLGEGVSRTYRSGYYPTSWTVYCGDVIPRVIKSITMNIAKGDAGTTSENNDYRQVVKTYSLSDITGYQDFKPHELVPLLRYMNSGAGYSIKVDTASYDPSTGEYKVMYYGTGNIGSSRAVNIQLDIVRCLRSEFEIDNTMLFVRKEDPPDIFSGVTTYYYPVMENGRWGVYKYSDTSLSYTTDNPPFNAYKQANANVTYVAGTGITVSSTNTSNRLWSFSSKEVVDVTDFSTMEIKWIGSKSIKIGLTIGSYDSSDLYIYEDSYRDSLYYVASETDTGSEYYRSIDISGLKGIYHISCKGAASATGSSTITDIQFRK